MNSSLKNDLQDYLQGKNFFQELCSYFCPYYIGPNYSPSEEYDGVLLVSEGVLLRDDPALDIKKEAYAPFKDSDVYFSRGFSAHDCICIIRELLKKYDLDLDEDFVYSARPSSQKENELDRIEVEKQWCEKRKADSEIRFDRKNSTNKLVRFTTPYLDSIIPESTDKLSPWGTTNFYFYEIANYKGTMHIQLYFYCKNLTSQMKDAFIALSESLDLGELNKGYKLYFKSFEYTNKDEDTEETVQAQLDMMFEEVKSFEAIVASKWNQ